VSSDVCAEVIAAMGTATLSLLRLCQSEQAALANGQLAAGMSSLATELHSAAAAPVSPSEHSRSLLASVSYQRWLELVVYLHYLHRRLHLLTTEELASALEMLTDREVELMELWSMWEADVAAAMRRQVEVEKKQEEEKEEQNQKDARAVLRECRQYRLSGEDEEEKEADVSDLNAQPVTAVHERFIEQLKLLRAKREEEPGC
jgi:hypothetical protein